MIMAVSRRWEKGAAREHAESSMVWVTLASFIGCFGAVGLKAGAKRLDKNLKALITNWQLALGIGGYLVSSIFFILGVRHGDLTRCSRWCRLAISGPWFGRKCFSPKCWSAPDLGLGMILAGCLLLGLGCQ